MFCPAKTISNSFLIVRKIYSPFGVSFGARLEHFLDQAGLFTGLNVFEPVQDLPHNLSGC